MENATNQEKLDKAIQALTSAQQNIASSRDMCDEHEIFAWDQYQSAIDDLNTVKNELQSIQTGVNTPDKSNTVNGLVLPESLASETGVNTPINSYSNDERYIELRTLIINGSVMKDIGEFDSLVDYSIAKKRNITN
jgi:hypothetical protein